MSHATHPTSYALKLRRLTKQPKVTTIRSKEEVDMPSDNQGHDRQIKDPIILDLMERMETNCRAAEETTRRAEAMSRSLLAFRIIYGPVSPGTDNFHS